MLYDSDLATKARNFDQKNIFLVQGTSDKIVHQQHSLWLAKALIKNGVEFRQQVGLVFLIEAPQANYQILFLSDLCR